jgi:hypothetical protein
MAGYFARPEAVPTLQRSHGFTCRSLSNKKDPAVRRVLFINL